MSPDELKGWETILQSPVAAALLLLAAVVVTNGFWVAVVRVLWRENRQSSADFRRYLMAGNRITDAIANARELIDLTHKTGAPDDGRNP
ncbi:MAG TPA: hypothetical protein VGC13_22350 [Longimicrobium sp.]|jgi:hypothetical protein|uniref:hypothetical protein n=1 Tax=Longimicrobium sp. TaxID=2029185 RepID=UPI002EDB722F